MTCPCPSRVPGFRARAAFRALALGALAFGGVALYGAALAQEVNPLASLSLDALSATRERPLFSPSRRPPPKLAEAAPEAPPPPPPPPEPATLSLKLVGVVESGDVKLGLFLDSNGKLLRLRVGETSEDGWTLQSVGFRSAALEKDRSVATAELAPRSADLASHSADLGAGLTPSPRFAAPQPQPQRMPAPPPPRPIVGHAGPVGAPPDAMFGGRDAFNH